MSLMLNESLTKNSFTYNQIMVLKIFNDLGTHHNFSAKIQRLYFNLWNCLSNCAWAIWRENLNYMCFFKKIDFSAKIQTSNELFSKTESYLENSYYFFTLSKIGF